MKKITGFLLTLLLVLVLGCALAAADTTTLLVYLCGTDLQDAACEDIVEMAEVEAGDAINIVVLAGGAEQWVFEELGGNTRTLAVLRAGNFEDLEDTGYAYLGDPASLQEFLV